MSIVFTEANTGLDDKEVIKKMNEEYEPTLKSDLDCHDYTNSSAEYKNAIHEYCMYQILLKYKDYYYQNVNVISFGPPDFFGDDYNIQSLYNSLSEKFKHFHTNYKKNKEEVFKLQTKIGKLNEQLTTYNDNLEIDKKINNFYCKFMLEREKYDKLKSARGTEH